MTEILKTNPVLLRGCILYEFLGNRQIFDAYKKLCRKLGDDFMDYVEFEYWFMRFTKGDFNFHYDRSRDPKQLTFSELPTDMLAEIVKHLDPKERKITRKVSKTLLTVVDRLRVDYDEIEIFIGMKDRINVTYNDDIIDYICTPTDCIVDLHGGRKSIDNCDYVDLALNDLAISLKPSKVFVRKLRVSIEEKACGYVVNRVFDLLRSVPNGFHVKETLIETANSHLALSVLSFLKPGFLESIEIFTSDEKSGNHEQIMEMEQFKKTKCVLLRRFGIYDPSFLARFYAFTRFQIVVNSVDPVQIQLLREALLKSPNFSYGSIITSNVPLDYVKIGDALGSKIVDSVAALYDKIPGTTNTLKILISMYDVLLCRN